MGEHGRSTDGGPGLRHRGNRGRPSGFFEACSWRILLSLGSLKGAQRQRGEISMPSELMVSARSGHEGRGDSSL